MLQKLDKDIIILTHSKKLLKHFLIIKATETRKCTNGRSEIIDNDTDDEDVMILFAYLNQDTWS